MERQLMYSLKNNLLRFVWEADLGNLIEDIGLPSCFHLQKYVWGNVRFKKIVCGIIPRGSKDELLLVTMDGILFKRRGCLATFVSFYRTTQWYISKNALSFIQQDGRCLKIRSKNIDLLALHLLFGNARKECLYACRHCRTGDFDSESSGYKFGNYFASLDSLWEKNEKENARRADCFVKRASNAREKELAMLFEVASAKHNFALLDEELRKYYKLD